MIVEESYTKFDRTKVEVVIDNKTRTIYFMTRKHGIELDEDQILSLIKLLKKNGFDD